MWTPATRAQHKRDHLRFASDVTDAEWAVLEPLLPKPTGIGRPPAWELRDVLDAIFHVLSRPTWRSSCAHNTVSSGSPP